MFDFIPLPLYEPIFDIFILILVMWVVFLCQRGIIFNEKIVSVNSLLFIFVAVAIILYMGMRNPWGTVFGDTTLYTHNFMQIKKKGTPFSFHFGGEWAFNNLMNYFARYSDIKTFFTPYLLILVFSVFNFLPSLEFAHLVLQYSAYPFLKLLYGTAPPHVLHVVIIYGLK